MHSDLRLDGVDDRVDRLRQKRRVAILLGPGREPASQSLEETCHARCIAAKRLRANNGSKVPSRKVLPVHRWHPRILWLALVDAAADALGERLGLRPAHRGLDERGRRAAFLHQLDFLHRRERLQRLADTFFGDVVRQVADHDAHQILLCSMPSQACSSVYATASTTGPTKMPIRPKLISPPITPTKMRSSGRSAPRLMRIGR